MLPGSIVNKKTAARARIKAFALFSFGMVFPVAALYAVQSSMTEEKQRRHMSIARDIEREKWRRKELGLPPDDNDDGFMQRFQADSRNATDIAEAKKSIQETIKIMEGQEPKPEPQTMMEKLLNYGRRQ